MMRFYRALLHLYPASFRDEYGDELVAAFATQRAGAHGLFASLATAFLAVADVLPNAIATHWDMLRHDLRYTVRSLRRTPAFAITAVLVVALGVGANAAAFSVANFVLLKPLSFPKPEQLVKLWERTPGYGKMELSPANYRDWKASAKSYTMMGAVGANSVNLTGSGEPRRLRTAGMTSDVFALLGTRPLIGRVFAAADTVAGDAIVLSYALWQTQFGGESSVLGKRVELDGRPYSIIGVMPESFRFPTRDAELWTTMPFSAADFEDRADNRLEGVARLKDGVTVEQAKAELDVIAQQLERQYPKENEKTGATIYRFADELGDRTRLLLYALCGAALCILLLACANLANLLIVRAVSRAREISVRTALGAGRERLVRQLVTESALLVVLGAVAGIAVAVLTVPALARLVPTTLPIAEQPTLDVRVLLLATALISITGIGFGVIPAMRNGAAAMGALRDGARAGGGRRQRGRAVLVMIEVMASVVLLISSGLLMRAMWRLQSLDPGFRTDGVLTLRTALPTPKYNDPLTRYALYTRVLSGVRALPGVSSAAYISGVPMSMSGGIWGVVTRGQEVIRDASNTATLRYATPQFFATLGIALRRGRDIAETDDADRPFVAVVSESFAKRYWPNEDPIGKHFQFALSDRMVVGVVGDVRHRGFEQTSEPQVYVPPKQVRPSVLTYYSPKDLAIRSSLSPSQLLPEVRRIVREADPLQPISNVQTMDEIVTSQTASRRAQLRVLGILAAIALLLASVGIHGLLSFAVSRRTQEIGVRVALGAERSGILAMFLREGLLLGLGGVVPGVAIAYVAGRGMEALLAGVHPADPLTVFAGVALCCLATLVGCLRPALRASRIDPIEALRAE
ncbi:MAG: ABC transporter permease [bacterium]